jgi:hypothetical protein
MGATGTECWANEGPAGAAAAAANTAVTTVGEEEEASEALANKQAVSASAARAVFSVSTAARATA